MKALPLQLTNGEYRVDSRVLAKRLQNHHKNVMELIDRYASRFARFGLLPFQTEAVKKAGARGAKHEKFALLNEDQSYFLLTLARNSDHVVDLKANLVHTFKKARQGGVDLSSEYLPGYHDLHETVDALAQNASKPKWVHANFNKLVNKTVGITSGQRSKLEPPVKSLTVVVQTLARQALEGANDHKDGYSRAKQVLEQLGRALTFKPT